MLDLWFLLMETPVFANIAKKQEQKPINFTEFNTLLSNETGLAYFKFLSGVAATVDTKFQERTCFLLGIFDSKETKEKSPFKSCKMV